MRRPRGDSTSRCSDIREVYYHITTRPEHLFFKNKTKKSLFCFILLTRTLLFARRVQFRGDCMGHRSGGSGPLEEDEPDVHRLYLDHSMDRKTGFGYQSVPTVPRTA